MSSIASRYGWKAYVPNAHKRCIEKTGDMRKVILTAAVFSAVLLTTQAALFVHLVCEEGHGEHDSHNCPICQQLFVTAKNIIVEEHTEFLQAPYFVRDRVFQIDVIPAVFSFHVSGPRAPPVCL